MVEETRTRFRIYIQSPILGAPFDKPQVISVNRAPLHIAPGPTDVGTGNAEPLLYVLDAKKRRYDSLAKHYYDEFDGRPWSGACHAKAQPGPDGHYDHLDPHEHPRQFAQACVYGSVRFVLECWQNYLEKAGRKRLHWHHRAHAAGINNSLELNPWSTGVGARAGYGFLEFGHGPRPVEPPFSRQPLWRNFDVIAHEFGHSMLFALLGFPQNVMNKEIPWYSDENKFKLKNGAFLAFHESAGDLVAMITSLHHDIVIDDLLAKTGGELRASVNVLSRIGEFDKFDPGDLENMHCIRNAANPLALDKLSLENDGVHRYSLPLTGAVYGLFVDEFEDKRSSLGDREAIVKARDYLGELLARAWGPPHLRASKLDFSKVRKAIVDADLEMGGKRNQSIGKHFEERGIH